MIELAGKIFALNAITAVVPGTRKDTTYITLRGGASFTLEMPYDDVRSRLIVPTPPGVLATLPIGHRPSATTMFDIGGLVFTVDVSGHIRPVNS